MPHYCTNQTKLITRTFFPGELIREPVEDILDRSPDLLREQLENLVELGAAVVLDLRTPLPHVLQPWRLLDAQVRSRYDLVLAQIPDEAALLGVVAYANTPIVVALEVVTRMSIHSMAVPGRVDKRAVRAGIELHVAGMVPGSAAVMTEVDPGQGSGEVVDAEGEMLPVGDVLADLAELDVEESDLEGCGAVEGVVEPELHVGEGAPEHRLDVQVRDRAGEVSCPD